MNLLHVLTCSIMIVALIPGAFATTNDIASFDSSTIQVTPTPIPTPVIITPTLQSDIETFGGTTIQVTPTPTPTPTIQTPTLRPDIETLLRSLLTQGLSSADRAVLTTELERLLDELTEGQAQISVEYEDGNEEDKTLTITVTPIEPTTPIEEEAEEDNDSSDNGNNDNDNGSDAPPEEPSIDTPVPPFG